MMRLWIILGTLLWLSPGARAQEVVIRAPKTSEIVNSTSAVSMLLSGKLVWKEWLAAQFPLKEDLTAAQKAGLAAVARPDGLTESFVGGLFPDGATGALRLTFSPSRKTVKGLAIYRLEGARWRRLLWLKSGTGILGAGKKVFARSPAVLFYVSMMKLPVLCLSVSLGEKNDELYGDLIVLIYDPVKKQFFEDTNE